MNLQGMTAGPARTVQALLLRLRQQAADPKARLKFGVCKESGWLQGSAGRVAVCADLWNHRAAVAQALRLREALLANPDHLLNLTVGSCTCGIKTPDPEHHAVTCVYAAAQLLEA